MKRKKVFQMAVLSTVLGLGLAGCQNNSSSPAPSSPPPSSTTPSSTSPSSESPSSVQPSTPAPEPTKNLTPDMIEEAVEGYAIEAYLVNTYDMPGEMDDMVYEQYMDAEADEDFYHVKSYVGSYDAENEEVTKDAVEQDQYYTHTEVGGVTYGAYAAIGASNHVEASQIPLLWEESFSNFFAYLTPDNFVRGDEDYHFDLDLETVSDAVNSAIMSQCCGGWGYLLESFELVTDGFHIVGFNAVSAFYESYEGGMIQTAECTVTRLGEGAFVPLEPYEGTEDSAFEEAMDELAKGNYHVNEKITMDNGDGTFSDISEVDVDVAGGILTYQQGEDTSVYVDRDGSLHEVTAVPDDQGNPLFYKDGYSIPGGGIPSFDISSIFFDKGEDGVYVFDAESYPDVWPELSSFDPMNAESLQVVSVEIGEDEVVFKATGFIYTYAITYSKIGEVTPLDLEIPEDLDYLRISDAWSIADIKGIFGLSALSDENASAILDQVPIDLFHGNPGIYTFSDNTGASFPAIGYEFVAETQDEALVWVNGEFVSFVDTMLADDGYAIDYDTFAYYKEVTIGEDVYRIDVTYSIALSEKENTYIVAYIPNIALVK